MLLKTSITITKSYLKITLRMLLLVLLRIKYFKGINCVHSGDKSNK